MMENKQTAVIKIVKKVFFKLEALYLLLKGASRFLLK